MLSYKQISDFKEKYQENAKTIRELERKLSEPMPMEDWIHIVVERSNKLHAIFLENQRQLDALFDELNKGISLEHCDQLCEMLLEFYYSEYDEDAMLNLQIIDAILAVYEKYHDVVKILDLKKMKSVLMCEFFYRQSNHTENDSYRHYHDSLNVYWKEYAALPAREQNMLVANAYNIICVLPLLLPHEMNELLDYYIEFEAYVQACNLIKVSREPKVIQSMLEGIATEVWNMAEKIEYLNASHLLKFYELVKHAYENDSGQNYNLKGAYYYTAAYLHAHMQKDTGINWQIAYEQLKEDVKRLSIDLQAVDFSVQEDFLVAYFYPFQENAFYLFLIYPHVQTKEQAAVIKELIDTETRLLNKFPKKERSWLIYSIYCDWCEHAMGCLEQIDDQMRLLEDLVIKGQVQTYIHSRMIALLAREILNHIMEQRPQLLLHIPGLSCIEDVIYYKAELQDYVKHAAMLHDIGKCRISSIINQQARKLTDEEFQLVRQHPQIPEEGILKYTDAMKKFYDIIKGHHRSYDGKSGYPEDFDPLQSPVKIIIDLITICDSIDAATDFLGRNYAGKKEIGEVLQELSEGAGTRYNPEIVSLILQDEDLQEALKMIVEQKRYEVYYATYQERFMKYTV